MSKNRNEETILRWDRLWTKVGLYLGGSVICLGGMSAVGNAVPEGWWAIAIGGILLVIGYNIGIWAKVTRL